MSINDCPNCGGDMNLEGNLFSYIGERVRCSHCETLYEMDYEEELTEDWDEIPIFSWVKVDE